MTEELVESDFDLMRRAQEGDNSGMDELHRRHVNQVSTAIFRQVRDKDDADDLLQQVFIRAWFGRRRFRFECSVLSWLLVIASNCSAEYWAKKKKRRRDVSLDDFELADERDWLLYRLSDRPEEPPEAYRRAEIGRCVRRALGELPEKYRLALELFCLEDMTYKELAVQLGIKPESVRGRLYRGRKLLKRRLLSIEDEL